MQITGDQYFKESNFFDFHLLSTLGITKEDIDTIERRIEIKEIMPAYSQDVMIKQNDKEYVVKTLSITDNIEQKINACEVIEGTYPKNSNECLMDVSLYKTLGYQIGDKVHIYIGQEDLDDKFGVTEFILVGTAQSPLYISREKGNSALGTGQLAGYILLPQSAYTMEVYTDLYITANIDAAINKFSKEYEDALEPVKKELEEEAKIREEIRYREVYKKANDELEKARREITDAEEKLNDAAKKIADGEKKLKDSEKELQNQKDKFYAETNKAGEQINIYKEQLEAGKILLDENEEVLNNSRKQIESAKQELEIKKEQISGLTGPEFAFANAQIIEAETALIEQEQEIDIRTKYTRSKKERI